jgi:hypothetical protein
MNPHNRYTERRQLPYVTKPSYMADDLHCTTLARKLHYPQNANALP